MDAFESDNFYMLGRSGRPAVVGDNQYANANAAGEANTYRAKHPIKDPNNKTEIEGAIIDLQNEIKIAQDAKGKCPKDTNVWGIISGSLTGGITAGISERCKNAAQSKIDGASSVLNTYQDMLQGLNAAATQKKQDDATAAAQAAQDAANAAAGILPAGTTASGSSALPWVLGGLAILAVGGIIIYSMTKKKPAVAAAA